MRASHTCHPEFRTASSGKGGQKRRVRDSAYVKRRHPSASLRRTPERSASARKRRCAQSKGACAPFVSGSVLRLRSGGLLRLRAAGTAGAKLNSAAALRSGCFRRWKKGLVSEQRGTSISGIKVHNGRAKDSRDPARKDTKSVTTRVCRSTWPPRDTTGVLRSPIRVRVCRSPEGLAQDDKNGGLFVRRLAYGHLTFMPLDEVGASEGPL